MLAGSTTGKGVRVAVIDSGIEAHHPRVGPVAGGVRFSLGGARVLTDTGYGDEIGHGTACAGVIRALASDVELYGVRVFDATLQTDPALLEAGITWATDNGMHVVNMSLGTRDVATRESLSRACARAVDAGVILVAAEDNEGVRSYPADLSCVIGVSAGQLGTSDFEYSKGASSEIAAMGTLQRVAWSGQREAVMGGASLAAPRVTALIARILEEDMTLTTDGVREILSHRLRRSKSQPRRANQHSRSKRPSRTVSWIRKAALYPYNKEMHAVIRGSDLTDFRVVGIGDPAGRGNAGLDAGEVIGLPQIGLRIAPSLSAVLEGSDALILGHVRELGVAVGRDVLRESITAAIEAGVNVFSLDRIEREEFEAELSEAARKGLRVQSPQIEIENVRQIVHDADQYPGVDVPVVAVVGTGSQQGKFSLQLALRRKLLALGYTLGQVGTEHHSELFGMDFTLPVGYAAALDCPLDLYPQVVDAKLREICHTKRPDIIIVGTQSGTVPYDVNDFKTHTLPTLALLMGIKPDACILVANSVDSDDYIEDTIDGIRAVCQAPTIALMISDQKKDVLNAYGRSAIKTTRMDRTEIRSRLQALHERFGVSAGCVASDEDVELSVQTIVNHFRA